MPQLRLPVPGQPHVVIEAAGETGILALDRDWIAELYKAHGALLFRGFGTGVADFGAFTRQFCKTSVVNESRGREPIDAGANIHTVDRGFRAFALHPELSREPWRPDVAFFACLKAPRSGGMTTICDGVALAREMSAEVRAGLENRRLVYLMPAWPNQLDYWLGTPDPSDAQLAEPPASCPFFFMRVPGGVARGFSRPALHKPMFTDERAFGNFLLFARFTRNLPNVPVLDDNRPVPEAWLQAIKATGDRLTIAIDWRAGDLVMLDNSRFMHGRTEISDPGERLIASHFGYLDFAIPDAEEPADPVWRRENFTPPAKPE